MSSTATETVASMPVSGRLRSVLLDPPHPDALREALAALAHLYPAPQDTAAAPTGVDIAGARDHVLDDVDGHLITAAAELECAYAPVVAAVEQLCTLVDDVVQLSQETSTRFEDLHQRTSTLVTESDSLQKQRHALSWQAEQTAAFLRKFSLNDAELLILNNPAAAEAAATVAAANQAAATAGTSRRQASISLETVRPTSSTAQSSSHGIGRPFFQVIDRLEQIREDCAELLGLVEEDEEDEEAQDEQAKDPAASLPSQSQPPPDAVTDAHTLTLTTPITSSRDPSQKKDMMRAGMNILRLTSEQLNTAHSRLARWCTFEFRQPFQEGVEVSPIMREAVRRLAEGGREDLLGPALSTLTETRSTALARAFNTALTQGGPPPTYLPRPIELAAHDPIRYIGDMLAWVHQALASERELLGSLVGVGDEDVGAPASANGAASTSSAESQTVVGRRIGQRRRWSVNPAEVIDMMSGASRSASHGDASGSGESDSQALVGSLAQASAASAQRGVIRPRERLRDLLDRDMEGCCRPLKVRITQTLHSQEGSITAFKLASLISFYSSTMEQTIGKKAALSNVLKELTDTAYTAFFATLDRQAAGLLRFSEPPESELVPPPPLLGACATLKELLQLHRASLEEEGMSGTSANTGSTPGQTRTESASGAALSDFVHVLTKLVDPMLAMCDQMAGALHTLLSKRRAGAGGVGGGAVGMLSFAGRGGAQSKAELENVGEWEVGVFLINCWSYIAGVLEVYDFVQPKVAELRARIQEKADRLTDLYYRYLLSQSGLAPLVTTSSSTAGNYAATTSDQAPSTLPTSTTIPKLAPAEVTKHLAHFDTFLASPNAVLISHPSLNKLQPAQLRNGIHALALGRLAEAYARVHGAYSAVGGGDGADPVVLRRTVEEMRLLLGAEQPSSAGVPKVSR